MEANAPTLFRRTSGNRVEAGTPSEDTPSEKPASLRSDGEDLYSSPAPPPEQPHFPDGGTQAWLVVFGGWCCLFASFGWIMCMGIFQDYYEHSLLSDYSSSNIAWIPSMQLFLMFALAPVFGKIFDDEGPFKLLVGGTLFHVFGLMMLSLSTSYYQIFLAQGVCSALGTSALFYAGNNTVGRWFAKRRALAIGLVSSGSSSGGLVISIAASRLLPKVGFPWTVRIIAFIYLSLLAVSIILVRTRMEHTRKPLRIAPFFTPLRDRATVYTALASFFFFLAVFVPYDFLANYATSQGFSRTFGLNLIIIANGTSIPGRIFPSWAGDRFGRFNAMTTITTLTALFTLALWIPISTRAGAVAFAVLYGFTSGSYVALIPACVAQLSPAGELGIRLGTNSMAVAVAVLFSNPIGGALLTGGDGTFLGLQVYAGVVQLIGAGFFGLARWAQNQKVLGRA